MPETPYKFARIPRDPVIPISQSYTEDWVRCLIDGKRVRNLIPYLAERYDMTGDEYRQHYGLLDDHPLMAGVCTFPESFDRPIYQPIVKRVSRKAPVEKPNVAVSHFVKKDRRPRPD